MGNQKKLNLNLLITFQTVARELNFLRASKKLGLSQPAISRQIAQLEEELGVSLFQRQKNGVKLTPAGLSFTAEVVPRLVQLSESLCQFNRDTHSFSGLCTVAFPTEVGQSILTDLLAEFQKSYPQVSFEIQLKPGAGIIDSLLRGEAEIGVCTQLPRSRSLLSERLCREELVLVSGAHQTLSLEDNPQPQFVIHKQDDPFFHAFLAESSLQGREFSIPFCVNSQQAMIRILLRSHCYGLLPHHAVAERLKSGSLHLASPHSQTNLLYLVTSSARSLPARVLALKDYLLKEGKDI